MKRLFFALTALAMLVTSCAKDNTTTPVVEGESVVSFKVSSPEMQTRYGEGTTANKLFYAVYQNGNLMSEVSALTADEAVDINITADVKIALVSGLTYDILFWAQNEDAPYVFDGKKVTITDPLKANEEAYDAFFRNYEAHINGTAPHYVELYRPFAQLNIGTGDIEKAKEAGFDLTKTALTVKTATVLDLATGVASEPKELSFTMNAKADDEYQGFDIISMNYLLVSNAGKELVNIKFEAEDASGKKIDRSYMNVPLERNHKTYMLGNILTTTQLFNVVIIPAFDGELPETAEEKLLMAAQMGGEVTLEEDITVSTTIIVTSDFVLNLNGKTITNKVDNTATDVIVVEEGATLTINGEGNVEAVSGNDGYTVISEGTVIINGGTFKSGVDATNDGNCTIYARGKGKVYINGGDFSTPAGDDTTYVLNKKDADRETTTIEVKGGTFHNFNPANNPAEGAGTNFVAEGYFSNKIGEDYVVSDSIIVSTDEELNAALALDLKNIPIVLAADVTTDITAWEAKPMGGQDTESVTIDGDGHTLTFNQTNSDWANVFCHGKVTLKNMNINKSGYGTDGGAWNTHVIMFNCEVELEDVTSSQSLGIKKNSTLKNVVINEDEEFYGLWVTANGMTANIDGLTINATNKGRGIKIADQYLDAPASVTLNIKNASFATEKKAAVLVTSKAGAVINWGEGNDISQVAADTEFAVWVDEERAAYANKVVVNGAYSKVEGVVVDIVEVESVDGLKDALVDAGNAGAGNTIIDLAEGEYTIPSDWTPISVDGYHGADIVTLNGNGAVLKGMTTSLFDGGFAGGSGIVIKDLTIEGATIVANNTQGYGAFVNCADSMEEITLINCHLINSSIITPNDGANGSRMGGLVGWTSGYSNVNDGPVKTYVNIKDCSVVGCTIKGAGSIGGICGHAGASDWTYTTIENCTVTGNTLISTDTGSWRVGVAVGTANVGQVTVNNLTENGNTLVQGDKVAPTGVRSYVGRLSLGTTGSFVVDGVAITE